MFTRSLRFAYARQAAASLGRLAESVALQGRGATSAPLPRLSLVARDFAAAGGRVELSSAEAMAGRRAAWLDLVSRSLEPNVFLEPDFALPAAQHVISPRRPGFLLVTDPLRVGKPGELIGLAALNMPRRRGGHGLARAWCHAQSALGLPLLDRARGGEALDLMLDWLAAEMPQLSAILFASMPSAGPVMQLIGARAAATGRPLLTLEPRARAILHRGGEPEALLAQGTSLKRLKKISAQRQRLAAVGELAYVESRAEAVRAAAERFLALEVNGWKGARGTALLNDPGLTAFTRSMTRLLARDGKCRIHSLELDGKPIAMAIVLASAAAAFVWKIAYDELYAAFSPGVQLMIEFTRRQIADPTIATTDSCATPDHPMIDRLWPDRLEISDVLLAPSAANAAGFAAAARRERIRRRLRATAKAAYYRALGMRHS